MVKVPPPKITSKHIVRPTLETPFHIDFEWWDRSGRELRVYLLSHLCAEHRRVFESHVGTEEIDWVDEDTGEVTRVDGLQHILRTHCSRMPNYISSHTTLIDAIFRVFLANSNKPLSPVELGQKTGRDPSLILRTLSGRRVYKGLRPYIE